jgi:phage FluMu protein Com
MRLRCYFCGKSVSTPVEQGTIVRALLVCPECVEAGRIIIPEREAATTEVKPT